MVSNRQFLRRAGVAILILLLAAASTRAQSDVIGSRGGRTMPTAPLPTLPPSLTLPPEATSSLLRGLQSAGTAVRPGMGWVVSDLAHQGIQGMQLADIIRQLNPYKQRGVLTFPQDQPGSTLPIGNQRPIFMPGGEKGNGHSHIMPGGGRGFGKGKR